MGFEELVDFLGKNPNAAKDPGVMAQIAQNYHRPWTPLNAIFRGLRVGENVGAGFIRGAIGAASDAIHFEKPGFGNTSKDLLELLPPWAFMAGGGKAVIGAAKGVRDDLTYEEWLKESNDPDSFLFKHSMIIGLGLSIVGDPTTYLTFGAGGVAKAAATETFTKVWMRNMDEAMKLSRTPGYAGQDVSHIMYDIGRKRGDPETIEQALDQLKAKSRAGELGLYRRLRPLGKQGMNVAGFEVPGTRALGKAIGARGREPGLKAMQHFIPDSKVHAISEDIQRTTFLYEIQRVLQAGAQVHGKAQQDALMQFATNRPLAKQLLASPSFIKRGALVKDMILGKVDAPFVPFDVRRNLLKPEWTPNVADPYGQRLARLRKGTLMAKGKVLKAAERAGFDEAQLGDMNDHWDRLVAVHSDPIDVISRFQGSVNAKIHNAQALDELLKNPMFARISSSDAAEEVAKQLDEVKETGRRLSDAKRALRAAKTSQQKAAWTSAVNRHRAANLAARGAYETAKETLKLEEKGAGPRLLKAGVKPMGFDWESGMPLKWRGVTYTVPEPIHHAIDQMRNPAFIDKELERWYRMVNWTQNKWKLLATAPNPQFHMMNAVGGMWNNLLAMVYNPFDHLATYADILRSRAERSGRTGVMQRADISRVPVLGPATSFLRPRQGRFLGPLRDARGMEADIAAGELRNVGGGFQRQEMDVAGKEWKRLAGARRSKKRIGFTAARRAYGTASLAAAIAPDEWVPDDIEAATFGGLGAAFLAPEIMRVGGGLARDVEEVNRYTPFRKYAHDRGIRQFIDSYSISPPTEFGQWIGKTDLKGVDLVQETMYDIGASIALRYQFDYSKLTTVERNWAKSLFPFYVFYKNNFILQAQEFAHKPATLSIFNKTREAINNYAESQLYGEDDPANNPWFKDLLPEYFDKLTMFQVPVPNTVREVLGLPRDQPLYLNPKLPFATLNMFPPVWELMNDKSVTPTPQKWMQVFAPIFGSVGPHSVFPGAKLILESMTGQQLGLARPIDYQRLQSGGWRNSQTEAPSWARILPEPLRGWLGIYRSPETGVLKQSATMRYVLDQLATPFLGGLGEPLSLAGGEATEKTSANTVAWMTGIRLTPVDPIRVERGWLYRMENFLEGRRAELKERGLEPPPDDAAFLREIRAQLKVVESAWDAKQESLYGNP